MKSIITFIVSLFFITGCGALEPPVIDTQGNNFSSSKNPSIQIELNEDFQFIGSYEDNDWWPANVTMKRSYLYAVTTSGNKLEKLIRITVLEALAGRNLSPSIIQFLAQNTLQESFVQFGKRKFQFCIKAQKTAKKQTEQFLLEKGITTSQCYMLMQLGKVFGNTALYITFHENISNNEAFGINSCADWKDKELLNDTQREYLIDFERKVLDSIKIL